MKLGIGTRQLLRQGNMVLLLIIELENPALNYGPNEAAMI